MNRSFGKLELRIDENKVESIFGDVEKTLDDGTVEEHALSYMGADYICNCQGFMINKKCRHTDALAIIVKAIDESMEQAMKVLNAPRGVQVA